MLFLTWYLRRTLSIFSPYQPNFIRSAVFRDRILMWLGMLACGAPGVCMPPPSRRASLCLLDPPGSVLRAGRAVCSFPSLQKAFWGVPEAENSHPWFLGPPGPSASSAFFLNREGGWWWGTWLRERGERFCPPPLLESRRHLLLSPNPSRYSTGCGLGKIVPWQACSTNLDSLYKDRGYKQSLKHRIASFSQESRQAKSSWSQCIVSGQWCTH